MIFNTSSLGSLAGGVSHSGACATSPLPALPNNTILQHLLARGIIVDTNTNHVPFTALPASQPSVTFPVTSRNARSCARNGAAGVDSKQWGEKKKDNLTNKSCEENTGEKASGGNTMTT